MLNCKYPPASLSKLEYLLLNIFRFLVILIVMLSVSVSFSVVDLDMKVHYIPDLPRMLTVSFVWMSKLLLVDSVRKCKRN